MLLIGGEFDLSVGSRIGFDGICIAGTATKWVLLLWSAIFAAFALAV